MRITPHWFDGNNRFWYRNDLAGGAQGVHPGRCRARDAAAGLRSREAGRRASRRRPGRATRPIGSPSTRSSSSTARRPSASGSATRPGSATWIPTNAPRSKAGEAASPSAPAGPRRRIAAAQGSRPSGSARARITPDRPGGLRSPDGKWTAFVKDHNVFVRAEGKTEEIALSNDGKEGLAYGRLSWSPDSKTLVAFRIEPGDRKEVYLIQSSPPGGGRAKLQTRPYPLPGDKFTAYELNLFDVAAKKAIKPEVDRIDFDSPQLRWDKDGRHFTYEKIDRGHQRFRLIEVDSQTGEARNLIDEKSKTFIWTAHREAVGLSTVNWLDESDEIIYVSERDGWRHLYLIDAKTGTVKNPITKGEYVVRGIDRIDEAKRQVWFRASGKNPDQDPYFIHYYRVNFDGTGLVALTEGNGSHSVQYSPDRRYLIDTYSRVDMAPVHELRRVADGKLVCKLEEADITALKASGWQPPEVFVAKGRDGKTDIWGIICRPKNFDPTQEVPGHRADLRRPAGLVRPQDVQRRPAVLVADRPGLHRRADGRHGDGQPLQGVSRRLLAQHQGRRLPRPHPLAPGRRQEIPLLRPRPAWESTAPRPAARTRPAACCSIPSSTRRRSRPAAATTTGWTRPRGTSSGWDTRSAPGTPSRRTSTTPSGSRASCS